jgi:hypothetical protein
MSEYKRQRQSSGFKSNVGVEAGIGFKTIQQIAKK